MAADEHLDDPAPVLPRLDWEPDGAVELLAGDDGEALDVVDAGPGPAVGGRRLLHRDPAAELVHGADGGGLLLLRVVLHDEVAPADVRRALEAAQGGGLGVGALPVVGPGGLDLPDADAGGPGHELEVAGAAVDGDDVALAEVAPRVGVLVGAGSCGRRGRHGGLRRLGDDVGGLEPELGDDGRVQQVLGGLLVGGRPALRALGVGVVDALDAGPGGAEAVLLVLGGAALGVTLVPVLTGGAAALDVLVDLAGAAGGLIAPHERVERHALLLVVALGGLGLLPVPDEEGAVPVGGGLDAAAAVGAGLGEGEEARVLQRGEEAAGDAAAGLGRVGALAERIVGVVAEEVTGGGGADGFGLLGRPDQGGGLALLLVLLAVVDRVVLGGLLRGVGGRGGLVGRRGVGGGVHGGRGGRGGLLELLGGRGLVGGRGELLGGLDGRRGDVLDELLRGGLLGGLLLADALHTAVVDRGVRLAASGVAD